MTDHEVLSRLGDWVHEMGANLKPTGGYADTHGDGMRHAKEQVSRILQRRTSTIRKLDGFQVDTVLKALLMLMDDQPDHPYARELYRLFQYWGVYIEEGP